MEKFVKFECHDYMDMSPHDYVRTFIAPTEEEIRKEAIRFAQHMNQNYSGGTTKFICVMNADEAKAFVDRECEKAIDSIEPNTENTEEVVNKWITDTINLYNKCYGEARYI